MCVCVRGRIGEGDVWNNHARISACPPAGHPPACRSTPPFSPPLCASPPPQLVATMLYLDSENKKDMNLYINVSGGEVSCCCPCCCCPCCYCPCCCWRAGGVVGGVCGCAPMPPPPPTPPFTPPPPQVVPCLAIHDTMRHIKSDVGTVGFGGCMGMSGFLLAVGKKVGWGGGTWARVGGWLAGWLAGWRVGERASANNRPSNAHGRRPAGRRTLALTATHPPTHLPPSSTPTPAPLLLAPRRASGTRSRTLAS